MNCLRPRTTAAPSPSKIKSCGLPAMQLKDIGDSFLSMLRGNPNPLHASKFIKEAGELDNRIA